MALVAYAILWVVRWLFDWTPYGPKIGEAALVAGSVVLVLSVVDAVEALEQEMKWLRAQSDRIRIEANREAIEWLRENEGEKFDAGSIAAYLEGLNKRLHEVTRTPAPPATESE